MGFLRRQAPDPGYMRIAMTGDSRQSVFCRPQALRRGLGRIRAKSAVRMTPSAEQALWDDHPLASANVRPHRKPLSPVGRARLPRGASRTSPNRPIGRHPSAVVGAAEGTGLRADGRRDVADTQPERNLRMAAQDEIESSEVAVDIADNPENHLEGGGTSSSDLSQTKSSLLYTASS